MCFVSLGKLRTRGLVISHSLRELELAEILAQMHFSWPILVLVTTLNPKINCFDWNSLPVLDLLSPLYGSPLEKENGRDWSQPRGWHGKTREDWMKNCVEDEGGVNKRKMSQEPNILSQTRVHSSLLTLSWPVSTPEGHSSALTNDFQILGMGVGGRHQNISSKE